jgi:uncharacterized NAD(P)/FAD-binding protein YdhS
MITTTARSGAGSPIRLAICGGGALSALLLQVLKRTDPRGFDVTVFEPGPRLGVGLAYSTNCKAHLLNTRACTMSLTENPDDFVSWLRTRHPRKILNWNGDDFAPRMYFAEYVQERMAEVRAAPWANLTWRQTAVDSLIPQARGWQVVPAAGEPVEADVVVLATGNETPRPLATQLAPAVSRFVIDNPWDPELKSQIRPDASVLLVGTGLTSVDVAMELLDRRHTGPVYAVSRRGLFPRSHGPAISTRDPLLHALPSSVREIVRYVRRVCGNDPRGERWRRAFIELRGVAPSLWRGWTPGERRRFLRHVRPFWEAHRHRLPLLVHHRLQRALAKNQLCAVRGRITGIEQGPGTHTLRVSVRSGTATRVMYPEWIINCTGADTDIRRSTNPLLSSLVSDGIVSADRLGLGICVDRKYRVVAPNGSVHPNLYALGALTKGTFWEAIAFADLREQVRAFAGKLLHDNPAAVSEAPHVPATGGATEHGGGLVSRALS